MPATSELKVTITGDPSVAKLDAQLKRIEARIGRIQGGLIARPGDTVVVLVPGGMRPDHAAMIRAQWAAEFTDIKLALICVPGASLG